MSEKYNAALGAFEKIKNIDGPLDIGIGTGSTTDIFTENFLTKIRDKIGSVYSSSKRTTNLLKTLDFHVEEGKPNKMLDLYIDGADEVDKNFDGFDQKYLFHHPGTFDRYATPVNSRLKTVHRQFLDQPSRTETV